MTQTKRAIIRVYVKGGERLSVNYRRRMYAIIRRYTPDAVEGGKNECFADLTGLRTFFKMTYQEMMENIVSDLRSQIGIVCVVSVTTSDAYEQAKNNTKKTGTVSTYKEINSLFKGASFVPEEKRSSKILRRKVRLTVPFLGKVA